MMACWEATPTAGITGSEIVYSKNNYKSDMGTSIQSRRYRDNRGRNSEGCEIRLRKLCGIIPFVYS